MRNLGFSEGQADSTTSFNLTVQGAKASTSVFKNGLSPGKSRPRELFKDKDNRSTTVS